MANEQVAIRLTSQGGDQILRTLEQIGAAAQSQFRRAADEARAFSREAANLAQAPVSRSSTQIHAEAFAGVNDNRASAASRAADIAAYGATLDSLRAKYSPLYAAQRQYLSALDEIRGAERSGALTRSEAAAALERTKSAFAAQVTTLRGVKQPLDEHTKSVGLARYEWINLSRQFQDVGVSLAGGQAPLTVLLQQGSQIGDVFGSHGGGAGAALKEFGGTALRVATHPLTILTAGLAAAAYATYQFSQQQTALERSLNGVGRLSGATAGDLRSMAMASSRSGGLSNGQAIDAAAGYASAGIGAENIPTLLADTQRYSHAFGLDVADAQKEITQIVGDSGVGALEKRFGSVSFVTKEWVRSLESSGRYAEATALKTRLLDEETKKATDTASGLQKMWEGVVRWATTPILGVGPKIDRMIRGPSTEEQLASARGEYFNLRAQRRGDASAYPGEAAAEQRVRQLEQQLQEERARPARERRDLELNRLSQRAGEIVDAANPDTASLRQLKESRDSLKKLVDSDGGLAKLGDRADDARKTLGNLENQIATWSSATDRMRQDTALAVREINARSYAERESVAMDRARLQVMRESGDAAKASAAAEAERAKMLAESARKADDMFRSSKDQNELARLLPFERAMKEIDFKYRDAREQLQPNSATPMAREFDTAAMAARNVTDAFNGVSNKIGGGSNVVRMTPRGDVSTADPRGMSSYIRDRAGAYGIDPDIALRVARSEGLANFYGDNGTSFGAFQLHVGGGLGDEFRKSTGLDPSDPANERAGIDYSLMRASKMGWGPFHGAQRVGIGEWEGIGRAGAANENRIGSKLDAAQEQDKSAQKYTFTSGRLRDVNMELDNHNRLLDAQRSALGADDATLKGVTDAQSLYNRFLSDGIDPMKMLVEAEENGVKTTMRLSDAIQKYGQRSAEQARKDEEFARDQKRYKENLDIARGGLSGSLSSIMKAGANGEDIGAALEKSLTSIRDNMFDTISSRLTENLLGKTGSTDTGLLGQLFGGLGLGGQQQTAQMNVQAGIVTVNGGVGTGAAGGRLVGSAVSWLGNLFSIGKNAEGTDYWRGGLSWVGERGPELLNLPRGSQIMPNSASVDYARNMARFAASAGGAGSSQSPAGSHPPTQVSFVNAPSGANVDVKEKRRSDGGVTLDVTFVKMLKKAAANGALESFGVRRPMKAR